MECNMNRAGSGITTLESYDVPHSNRLTQACRVVMSTSTLSKNTLSFSRASYLQFLLKGEGIMVGGLFQLLEKNCLAASPPPKIHSFPIMWQPSGLLRLYYSYQQWYWCQWVIYNVNVFPSTLICWNVISLWSRCISIAKETLGPSFCLTVAGSVGLVAKWFGSVPLLRNTTQPWNVTDRSESSNSTVDQLFKSLGSLRNVLI